MPDQESFSPLPLEGADERSEAGLASPRVKIPLREPTSALRGTSFQRKEGVCRLPVSSFRAKARNLFRSRSGKGCEDSGELEAPCFQRIGRTVFHADSITKENGNGKRKRSLGCARDDETGETLLHVFFIPLRKPTSAPFGAPPSRGRRWNSAFLHRHFE